MTLFTDNTHIYDRPVGLFATDRKINNLELGQDRSIGQFSNLASKLKLTLSERICVSLLAWLIFYRIFYIKSSKISLTSTLSLSLQFLILRLIKNVNHVIMKMFSETFDNSFLKYGQDYRSEALTVSIFTYFSNELWSYLEFWIPTARGLNDIFRLKTLLDGPDLSVWIVSVW